MQERGKGEMGWANGGRSHLSRRWKKARKKYHGHDLDEIETCFSSEGINCQLLAVSGTIGPFIGRSLGLVLCCQALSNKFCYQPRPVSMSGEWGRGGRSDIC